MKTIIGKETKFDYINIDYYLRAKELSSRFGYIPELKHVHEYITYIEETYLKENKGEV